MDTSNKNQEADTKPQNIDTERMEMGSPKSPTIPEEIEQRLLATSEGEASESEKLTKAVDDLKLRRKGLSQAARKRFKWLLGHGHTEEEARELALIPVGPKHKPSGEKRSRSDGSTPEGNTKRRKDAQGALDAQTATVQSAATVSYRQAAESTRVGIIPENFPDVTMTTSQMEKVQNDILEKILLLKEGDVKPEFAGCTFKPGFMVLACANKATAQWLGTIVGAVKPWEGAKLKAVEESDIPRPQILVGYFPNSQEDPSEKIMGFLKTQNEGLCVENWRVLHRASEKSCAQITFSMDIKSFENIKKKNFRLSYKFGQVVIRPAGSRAKTDKMEEKPETSGLSKPTAGSSQSQISTTSRSARGGSGPLGSGASGQPRSGGEHGKAAKNKGSKKAQKKQQKVLQKHHGRPKQ